jgi:Bacteriocin-protection, YdeI or OmpD-Associated/Domain of unknown function (DUF1905)
MKKYTFTARIEPGIGGGAGVMFPYDVEREFGTRSRVAVQSTFDGVPYAGSLVKCGDGGHMLGVLKSIREQLGKGPGDLIDVVLWKDEAERTIEVPAEFEKRMKKEGLLTFFQSLSYTHRKEYCRWITEAKKEETRQARVVKAIEMLKSKVKTPRVTGPFGGCGAFDTTRCICETQKCCRSG